MEGQHEIRPDYSEYLPKMTTGDRAHSDLFNMLLNRLINNDAWLLTFVGALMGAAGHKHTGAPGDAPQIGTAGIASGAVTPAKINLGGGFEVYYNADGGSLDFERPAAGIPYVRTDTTFAGVMKHMEVV